MQEALANFSLATISQQRSRPVILLGNPPPKIHHGSSQLKSVAAAVQVGYFPGVVQSRAGELDLLTHGHKHADRGQVMVGGYGVAEDELHGGATGLYVQQRTILGIDTDLHGVLPPLKTGFRVGGALSGQ